MRLKTPFCNCRQCRGVFKTQNIAGYRDSKRKYKSFGKRQKNERKRTARIRIKKLRQQRGDEIFNPVVCGYTD